MFWAIWRYGANLPIEIILLAKTPLHCYDDDDGVLTLRVAHFPKI